MDGPEAEKEREGSSSASHDGRQMLEDGGSDSLCSCEGGREETLRFFEDDVLKASCQAARSDPERVASASKRGCTRLGEANVYRIKASQDLGVGAETKCPASKSAEVTTKQCPLVTASNARDLL